MRDIRPGTAGRASNQPPHMAYMRHRAAQVRAHPGMTPVQALNQMRRGQIAYNKTAKNSVVSILGRGAHDLNTAIGITGFKPSAIPGHVKELIPGTKEYQRNQRPLAKGQKPSVSIGEVPFTPGAGGLDKPWTATERLQLVQEHGAAKVQQAETAYAQAMHEIHGPARAAVAAPRGSYKPSRWDEPPWSIVGLAGPFLAAGTALGVHAYQTEGSRAFTWQGTEGRAPATPEQKSGKYTKPQTPSNQKATDPALLRNFQTDVSRLLGDRIIKPAEAKRMRALAISNPHLIKDARNYLHSTYTSPSAGWSK